MDARVDKGAAVLAVDLDGTLIATDLLWECLFTLIRQNPLCLLLLPLWLARGKPRFKHEIFSRVDPAPETLPYRESVVARLRDEHVAGRRIVLATASCRRHAEAIAEHLGFFTSVIGSDAKNNLKSKAKVVALKAAYGDCGFDYMGNSRDDIAVFETARRAIAVAPDRAAAGWARAHNAEMLEPPEPVSLKTVAKMLRVHQWSKNILIAVPAVLDHKILEPTVILQLAGAFFAFSFLASAFYIVNDLFDLAADRGHPSKSKRPLAAGVVAPAFGVRTALVLIVASLAIGTLLPPAFLLVLAGYTVATFSYSLKIKRWLLIDVLVLASLYTVRVIAGSAATDIPPSPWLLAFSIFFFLSLALVKRFVELDQAGIPEKERLNGRGYRPEDKETISQAGIGSGFAAVVVLALYLESSHVHEIYEFPWVLWLLCPLVLYIILRIWILARRREFCDDPVVFIASDWRSQLMVALGGVLILAATPFPYALFT
ncbi:UbiA family prenyltransferase [Oricola cellulosilytica]|uniref:UbiA family prenyltransferase n=1 Tax=Oricola cellulosilytica TaxID=1429082 RepID=A0A4R0PCQ6_9HYPH|nr:UbiA family prenyltransferase [Oricola cellulosilytica]TCD15066.1 UbiA family prenyltransferase [Oricola cellulosilytica]